MNKFFCITLMILLFAALTQAQEARFGFKIGINQSNFTGSNLDSISTGGKPEKKTGINVGVSVNSKLTKHFWLKHDLFFAVKGAALIINDKINAPYKSNLNLYSIDIQPVSPALNINGFQLFAGLNMSALSAKRQKLKDESGILKNNNNFISLNKVDVGYLAGGEYEFPIGLNFGIRYQRGFYSVHEYWYSHRQWSVHNESIVFVIGYTFGGKTKNSAGNQGDEAGGF